MGSEIMLLDGVNRTSIILYDVVNVNAYGPLYILGTHMKYCRALERQLSNCQISRP